MQSTIIKTKTRKHIIAKSAWPKKKLADVHLEALMFCEFGCRYCSSNAGLHLTFLKRSLNATVEEVTGQQFDPHDAGNVAIAYDGIVEALDQELSQKRKKPGVGKTLVYSQLTDGFSPVLLKTETARKILDLLIEKTAYRIRILTKNAIVGNPQWVDYFADHKDRFVVGLSVGTLDSQFTHKMEAMTSRPQSRIQAMQNLQDAGVPTYGMLCPVFPQVLESDELEKLVDGIRPQMCEHVWAEPYNERHNWKQVRSCYEEGSRMWDWMTEVYGQKDKAVWSRYATELFVRIHDKAVNEGWSDKLRYLLYENDITASDAPRFGALDGVLLQSKPEKSGLSRNESFATIQKQIQAS